MKQKSIKNDTFYSISSNFYSTVSVLGKKNKNVYRISRVFFSRSFLLSTFFSCIPSIAHFPRQRGFVKINDLLGRNLVSFYIHVLHSRRLMWINLMMPFVAADRSVF